MPLTLRSRSRKRTSRGRTSRKRTSRGRTSRSSVYRALDEDKSPWIPVKSLELIIPFDKPFSKQSLKQHQHKVVDRINKLRIPNFMFGEWKWEEGKLFVKVYQKTARDSKTNRETVRQLDDAFIGDLMDVPTPVDMDELDKGTVERNHKHPMEVSLRTTVRGDVTRTTYDKRFSLQRSCYTREIQNLQEFRKFLVETIVRFYAEIDPELRRINTEIKRIDNLKVTFDQGIIYVSLWVYTSAEKRAARTLF